MGDQPSGVRFDTLLLHAGGGPAQDGAVDMPSALDRLLRPDRDPCVALLEERIAALEGGSAAVATVSAGAARFTAFQALLQPGDDIVAARGDAADALADAFRASGWGMKLADPDRSDSFVEALSDRTKAIFIESVAGRDGAVADIEAIARIARRARIPLVVDNSLATPYLLRPFEHGADIVLHDARAYLGGHGGAAAGFIVDGGSFDWTGDVRYAAITAPCRSGAAISELVGNFAYAAACRMLGTRTLGTAPTPDSAVLVLHGIETLALRMQRHADNALAVARYLERQPAVNWVHHPGLDGDPRQALARRYCARGTGAVFTFAVAPGRASGDVLDRLRLFTRSPAIGGSRSLVAHRAEDGPADAHAIRLAVGLEDRDDLIADLAQALAS